MARYARAFTSVVLAILILLEATPSFPATAVRSPTRRCEIASSVVPITLLALPSERSTSTVDPGAFERMPLATFTIAPAITQLAHVTVRGALHSDAAGHALCAWLQMHRQRARSPDDPDPL